ncbi:hypothetical protein ACHAQH_009587 [Verticillium albo-atrum]
MSHNKPPQTVLIVGAGIVGSALAHFLCASDVNREITVVDRSLSPLVGSTGHAPGFIGQFNDSEVLTRLAMDTVSEYRKIPGGFDAVGGLEVTHSLSGVERLKSRQSKAAGLGLPAQLMSIQQASQMAPHLVRSAESGAALSFATDGTADASRITAFFQQSARANGALFVEADVERLRIADGRATGIELSDGAPSRQLNADVVILATGIWAQALAAEEQLGFPLPVVPVGHPYLHGLARQPLGESMPFVRWPEHHVYARDHGDRYGLGTYDHQPLGCKPTNDTAIGDWVQGFDGPLSAATSLVPDGASEQLRAGVGFNGIFSMTPDNMPFAGAVQSVGGLYMAVAVWVTHAAGTAKFLTRVIDGDDVDEGVRNALNPERFRGGNMAALEKASLEGYNEIYKTHEAQL